MTAIEMAIRILEGIKKGDFPPDAKMHLREHYCLVNWEIAYSEITAIWTEPKNGKLCIE